MDNNTWIKINVVLRIVMILILLGIGSLIIYYKFGYVDPDDSAIITLIGDNITCKEALYYYAEKELKVFDTAKTNYTYTFEYDGKKVDLYYDLDNQTKVLYKDINNYSDYAKPVNESIIS